MRIVVNNKNKKEIVVTARDREIVARALSDVNATLQEYLKAPISGNFILQEMNSYVEANSKEDDDEIEDELVLQEALKYAFVRTLSEINSKYINAKDYNKKDVEEDLKKSVNKSDLKYNTKHLIKGFNRINRKCLGKNNYNFLFISNDEIKDITTTTHPLNTKSAHLALRFYIRKHELFKLSDLQKRNYIDITKDSAIKLMSNKYCSENDLYQVALIYQNIKRLHNKGLKIFRFFTSSYKQEANALEAIEASIKNSTAKRFINDYENENFIKYCKKGKDNYNLNLKSLDNVVYSPLYSPLLIDNVKKSMLAEYNKEHPINLAHNQDELKLKLDKDLSDKEININNEDKKQVFADNEEVDINKLDNPNASFVSENHEKVDHYDDQLLKN
jgi:hypothetical protein